MSSLRQPILSRWALVNIQMFMPCVTLTQEELRSHMCQLSSMWHDLDDIGIGAYTFENP